MSSTQIADLRVLLSADLSSLPADVRSAANVLKSYAADAKSAEDSTFNFGRSFGEAADLLSQKSQAIIGGFSLMQGAVLGVVGAAVGMASAVSSLAQQGRELEQMSNKAGVTVERMQELAYATEQYNVSGDQLADMLKDVQDKLGDFSATGGGEFADWMTNIAPKVGLTIEKLQQMSGPDALIAMQDAMDKTNVSAAEQVFYLESIANDVSTLQPLLRNNGAELQRLTGHYRNLNVALSETDISQLKEMDQQLHDVGLKLQGSFAKAVLGASEQIDWLTDKVSYAVGYWGTLFDSWADNPRTIDGMSRRLGNLREELKDLDDQIKETSEQKAFGGVGLIDAILGDTAGRSALPELQQRRAEIEAEIDRIEEAYGKKRFGIGEQPEYQPPEPVSSRDTSADNKKLLEQGEARLSALDMQFASELDKLRLSHEERLAEIDSLQVSEAELRRRGYESLSELREEYRQKEADHFAEQQADYMAKREEAMAKELEADQRKQDQLAEQERQRVERQKAAQQQAARDMLNFTSQTLSLTTDMLQQSGKEQTFIMKALLAAQKLLAIPSILVAGEQAEAGAAAFAAMTGGLLAAESARAMLKAQTMISVGIVAGTAIAGMAHDGIDTIPREGTWLLNTGERVYTNKSAQRIDQMYDQLMTGGGVAASGGAVFEQHFHFSADMTDTDRNQVITEAALRGYHMFIEDLGSNGQARRMLGV
ncbi:hypothetical protein [Aeromonas caviae]|uniref:hypothetical protein n=1 Tax=Aeromonas caviae TaxID=648 RepID=UPI001CC58A77|nr:hypothetical protein [Aeromonas caviae]GJA86894.1 hypothetical protein KAM356_29530 [Aeromonas caviae]GJA90910.1 hypothetical protein KAM357_28580 [Aeromonas caviae]GJB08287.1 hypothetical protein KAM361_29600 [Aeromonas caviae]GJB16855.1 hypothetical protein KAM363_28600 [Aeromonas caviae]GJB28127.1 hypothetical protein KAM366_13240 [Aeromonas caviae]